MARSCNATLGHVLHGNWKIFAVLIFLGPGFFVNAYASAIIFGKGSSNDFGSIELLDAGVVNGDGSHNGFRVSTSGSVNDLSNPELPRVTTDTRFSGQKAARFQVVGNNYNGSDAHFRSEFALTGYNRGQEGWEGTVHWIGWAFYLDQNWPLDEPSNRRTVLFQTHKASSEVGCSPTWGIRARGDGSMVLTQCFEGYPDRDFELPLRVEDLRGRWVRAVVQVKYDGNAKGFLRLWIDDKQVLDARDIRTWQPEARQFGYYKVGVYASWHQYVSARTKTMYVDALRIADERLGGRYSMVDPAAYVDGSAPVPPVLMDIQ